MFTWLKNLFFGNKEKQPAIAVPQSEVEFLRKQNLKLLEIIQGFQAPKIKASNPDDLKPQIFDASIGKYRAKTDAEIEADRRGMRELGII